MWKTFTCVHLLRLDCILLSEELVESSDLHKCSQCILISHSKKLRRKNKEKLDFTQGSAMAWYRDSRYQACACSKGNVHESESRIDQESSRNAENKRVFESRTDFESKTRPNFYQWKITPVISNQCFLRRFVSGVLFDNTDDFLAMIGNWCYLPV